MAEFEKQRNISYGARDFDQIKTELTSFVKQYFPSNYSDLSEGSGANVFLELVAYLGDVLNFYIDRQFKEVFSNSALEAKNIYAGARNKAFDPPTTTPASTSPVPPLVMPAFPPETVTISSLEATMSV